MHLFIFWSIFNFIQRVFQKNQLQPIPRLVIAAKDLSSQTERMDMAQLEGMYKNISEQLDKLSKSNKESGVII